MTDYGNGWQYDENSKQFRNAQNGMQLDQSGYNDYINQQNQQALTKQAADKNHQLMLAQGMNDDGSPIRKAFDSLIDPATGKLKDGYSMQIDPLDPTKWDGYSKLKSEALRTGPSAWAGLQNQGIDRSVIANKEAGAKTAQAGMDQGLSNLAMRGGYGEGSRAMLARDSQRNALNSSQDAMRTGDSNRLNVATTDETNRIGQLTGLANSESTIGQYNKTLEGKQQEYNINNMTHEQDAKRSYNDMTYQEQMKKWAADKQATATAQSGHGGKK